MNNRIKAAVYSLLAVILPFAVGVLLYRIKGIVPFGEQSVLAMDLWGQYMPMYVQQAGIHSLAAQMHSWNGALGYNNWAQSAYYTNSLFVQILRFVPPEKMIEALGWICLVKISLASFACFWYLKKLTQGRGSILLAGAVAYALCAYSLAFLSQPMWIDALAFAPLILASIDRLVTRGSGGLYSALLGACIISNFYIGFCLCIFCLLYFFFRCPALISGGKGERLPAFCRAFLRFCLYSFLAGALSGLVILPVGLAIGRTLASGQSAPENISWYAGVKAYLEMLLPGQSLKLEFEGVNIFSGIFVFSLIPLYFLNKGYRKEERILDAAFVAVLFLSMNCNVLDYVWHGFHFPNQLPGRWTFLFSLYVITLMAKGLSRMEGLAPGRLLLAAAAGAILWVAAAAGADEGMISPVYHAVFAAGELCLVGLAAAGNIHVKPPEEEEEKKAGNPLIGVGLASLALLQILGSAVNFLQVSGLEKGGLRTAAEPSYSAAIRKAKALGEEWKSGRDDFYRIEANGGTSFNPSMLGDYHGISYYSSTMDGNLYTLLSWLGNRVYAQNVSSVYNLSSPVQNGLLGIRYFFDISGGMSGMTCNRLAVAEIKDEGIVYENLTALPVAYAVADSALTFAPDDEVRAVINQESFLEALTGERQNIFEQMKTDAFSYTNCRLSESSDWNNNHYFRENDSEPVNFDYVYTCREAGPVFLENNFRAGNFTIQVGERVQSAQAAPSKLIYLGTAEKGDKISITLRAEGVSVGCCGINLYRFSEENWEKAYRKLSEQSIEVKAAGDGFISGDILLEKESLVMATLPQDGGWTFACDGKKLKTQTIGGVMLCARVPEGKHEIKLSYHVPGLGAGTAVSVGALLALILLKVIPPLKEKRRGKR